MLYDNKYGAKFSAVKNASNAYHNFRTWGLYPQSKPVISPPAPKVYTIDVPGANGVVDYTESLTGYVQYQNREGTFPYVYIGDRKQFDKVYHQVLAAIHGKRMYVTLDEDPGGYYYGRMTVEEPKYAKDRMYLTITGDFEPYKYEMYSSAEPWVWDTFSFIDGVIRNYSEIEVDNVRSAPSFDVNGDDAFILVGSPMPVVPSIYLLSGTIVKIGYISADGVQKTVGMVITDYDYSVSMPDLLLRDGENVIWLNGQGTIKIDYRGGNL